MNLFLISYWEKCKTAYNSSSFGRCLQYKNSSGTNFSNASTTSIYLHTYSKSDLKVVNKNGKSVLMKPGEQKSFVDSNVKVSCVKDFCPISFWNHNVITVNQYFANDAAGTVISLENQTLEDTYTVYCDFGQFTKINMDYMHHSRVGNTGRFYYMTDKNKLNHTILQDELEPFYIQSPFMLQVRSSKYVPISFRILAGSTFRPSKYFQKDKSAGGVLVYNGAMALTKTNNNTKFLEITKVTKINKFWINLEWFFMVIGSLIPLLTFILIIILIIIHCKRKHEYIPDDDIGLTI